MTVVRQGFIDHADSLGATARFGAGDTQWVTTGKGIVHSEMFPLIHSDKPNTLELFQIWLNLPKKSKMAPAHFTMHWNEQAPRVIQKNADGKTATVQVVAGALDDVRALPPPPESWAAESEAEVAIWSISLEDGATFTLPPAKSAEATRTLYAFQGRGLTVDGTKQVDCSKATQAILLKSTAQVQLSATDGPVELLLLQGVPIKEPVAQRGTRKGGEEHRGGR